MLNKNYIIQHGGFMMQFFILLILITLILCSSCACCNWPADLDNFLGGTFRSLKFRPFENLFKGFDIGNIGNPFSSFKV
jgi:hypothetical protein